jgi:hypothetical protein
MTILKMLPPRSDALIEMVENDLAHFASKARNGRAVGIFGAVEFR